MATSNHITPKPLPLKVLCSCVEYGKLLTGQEGKTWGNAWQIKPNIDKPDVGKVALFKAHVAVITAIDGDTLTIQETNWFRCKESERQVLISDLRGFFDPL